ncbi:M20 metallopeptidase family protein [Dielma fastidiosa]|uniref:Hippurate hydrolase n=1 Tax=Dielma fastidiosa TaxID=1034346 RepID=A0A318L864_9FIRM|nr:M20 family metallopeptidase [Dielma fastidiosa]PXX81683.1 hippurate hydrolase [Dielma fastidiosa]HAH93353.1 amidohydrolase [Dielma fastidiosa]
MKIRETIEKQLEEVKANRRSLHKIPEIGLNTVKTAAYLRAKGIEYGVDSIDDTLIENGLVMQIKAAVPTDKGIGLRSDIDALPMGEKTGVSFQSEHEGCMHACGHDGHMAAMLGTVQYLCEHRDQLTQNVTIVFQPGEESPGGAKPMIEHGLFDKYKIDCMIGMHVVGDLPEGKIGCRPGPMMARNGEFQFTVRGYTAHGAMPHDGKDAIVAACSLVMNLQTIVSRNVNPLDSAVITVGKLNAGEVRNVIADKAEIIGTMRSFSDANYEMMKQRMHAVAEAIAQMFNVEVELVIDDFYAVVNNDEKLTAMLAEVVGEDYVEIAPRMIAEDFSFYQQIVPGLFYYTSVGDADHPYQIHDSRFMYREEYLLNAIETNVRLMEKLGVLCG